MPVLAHSLVLDPVASGDDRALREWFELEQAARAHDVPAAPSSCWTAHRARLSAPWPGAETRAWLTRDTAGSVVGVAELELPTLDNLGTALGQILVAPEHRRRGYGTRLLDHLREQARAAGRVRLIVETESTLDETGPGTGFAAAGTAEKALCSVRRRLVLPADDATLARLDAAARVAAAGYDLEQWTDDTPARWQEDIAALTARMSTDAPLGDLRWEHENHDAQRVRDHDLACRARGLQRSVTAARSRDGPLVGFTEIGVTASHRHHAAQWNTLVDPRHRGHRLGLLLKIANLGPARTRHPGLRSVDTFNAASNSHMIAINEAMGFRPVGTLDEWQLDL